MKRTQTNRAEYSGSCQCCGAIQKLPANLLSKHGYNVKWGFFSGVCPGAGSQPYEKGIDLIERFIANAQTQRDDLQQFKARVLAPVTELKGWRRIWKKAEGRVSGSYHWMEVTYTVDVLGWTNDYQSLSYVHPFDTKFRDACGNTLVRNADEAYAEIHKYNAHRAQDIQNSIDQLERYIAWQQQRIAEWKLADYLPLQ